jgi:hypothetical protein
MLSGTIEGRNNNRAFAFWHLAMKGTGRMAGPIETFLAGYPADVQVISRTLRSMVIGIGKDVELEVASCYLKII